MTDIMDILFIGFVVAVGCGVAVLVVRLTVQCLISLVRGRRQPGRRRFDPICLHVIGVVLVALLLWLFITIP